MPRPHPARGATTAVAAVAALAGAVALSMAAVGPLVATGTEAAAEPEPGPPAAPPPVTRYTVRPGDTLASAAILHAVAPAQVAAANGLGPPFEVAVGQVLAVPPRPDPGRLPAGADAGGGVGADLRGAALAAGVPADLFLALAWRESTWRSDAVSVDGAVGIGQLLPSTAGWVASTLVGDPGLDPTRTGDNLVLSARYLRYLLDLRAGDEAAALAAYYQGPTSTAAGRWYDDTVGYVRDVFALRWAFASAVDRS